MVFLFFYELANFTRCLMKGGYDMKSFKQGFMFTAGSMVFSLVAMVAGAAVIAAHRVLESQKKD